MKIPRPHLNSESKGKELEDEQNLNLNTLPLHNSYAP